MPVPRRPSSKARSRRETATGHLVAREPSGACSGLAPPGVVQRTSPGSWLPLSTRASCSTAPGRTGCRLIRGCGCTRGWAGGSCAPSPSRCASAGRPPTGRRGSAWPSRTAGALRSPGGLAPLQVDREADTGLYYEPNVWGDPQHSVCRQAGMAGPRSALGGMRGARTGSIQEETKATLRRLIGRAAVVGISDAVAAATRIPDRMVVSRRSGESGAPAVRGGPPDGRVACRSHPSLPVRRTNPGQDTA